MRMSLCCCGQADGCFTCRIPNNIDLKNINLNFGSRVESGIEDGAGSAGGAYSGFATGVIGASFVNTWNATQRQFIPPDIPSSVQLRRRGLTPAVPGPIRLEQGIGQSGTNGLCQWLWNDILAYHWVYHGGAYDVNDGGVFVPDFDWKHTWIDGVMENTLIYTPENSYDPSSPWERIGIGLSDSRIGTCFITPQSSGFCPVDRRWLGLTSSVYSSACLSTETGYTPYSRTNSPSCLPAYPVLFKPNFSGIDSQQFWVLRIQYAFNRSEIKSGVAVYEAGATGYPAHSRRFHNPYPPVIQGIHPIEFGGWDNYTGNDETLYPNQPLSSGFAAGQAACVYAKKINCDTDFNGDPVTLQFSHHEYECGPAWQVQLDSVPPTVEISFNEV
jgi:hypothetical protein